MLAFTLFIKGEWITACVLQVEKWRHRELQVTWLQNTAHRWRREAEAGLLRPGLVSELCCISLEVLEIITRYCLLQLVTHFNKDMYHLEISSLCLCHHTNTSVLSVLSLLSSDQGQSFWRAHRGWDSIRGQIVSAAALSSRTCGKTPKSTEGTLPLYANDCKNHSKHRSKINPNWDHKIRTLCIP